MSSKTQTPVKVEIGLDSEDCGYLTPLNPHLTFETVGENIIHLTGTPEEIQLFLSTYYTVDGGEIAHILENPVT